MHKAITYGQDCTDLSEVALLVPEDLTLQRHVTTCQKPPADYAIACGAEVPTS